MAVSAYRRRMSEARALARVAGRRQEVLPELESDDAAFWQAVRSLPRRQAQAIALHYLEDRSISEVADILGCTPSTARVHLFNGRRALAEKLGLEVTA